MFLSMQVCFVDLRNVSDKGLHKCLFEKITKQKRGDCINEDKRVSENRRRSDFFV